ncbi:hypothetical protein HJG60_011731 [Phyllostomus discolor]|uniref:Uncharacterized protein n=1 Tax=Phyllostomus discolor TaxID=89673 RepID=A0A833ZYM7_9CHIR|nr:hypothetical protein HJG60_011731 [Phyllostomus discolor]
MRRSSAKAGGCGLVPPFTPDNGKRVSVRERAQTWPGRRGGGLRLESAWANCTSVCPEPRGEWAPSSSRLTEGSLYLFWGGCCDDDGCPPRPPASVSDSAAVVCVYCQVRSSYPGGVGGGEELASGTEELGKAGPAATPGPSSVSAVRAPSLLAKHSLSRQPPSAVVCALSRFRKSEDLEGFHRYLFSFALSL